MDNKQKTGAATQSKNADNSQSDKMKTAGNANEKINVQDVKKDVKDIKDDVKETVKQTADKAAGAAKNVAGAAKDKAVGIIDRKKSNLTSGLNDVADTIRKIGEDLREADQQTSVGKITSQYGETVAGTIENFSSYIEDARVKDVKRDVEDFARRQPLLFVGGAFALGLLAARFLKSSEPSGTSGRGYYERRYGA